MKTEQIKNIYNFINKMNKQEFNVFVDIISNKIELSKNEVEELMRRYALRNSDLKSLDNQIENENEWTKKVYLNEIKKINLVINDDQILQEIGGLKILLYGETGTGKTSLVENIINLNFGIEYEKVKWHNLVSPKMGQTQINIMQFESELSIKNKKTIIFIDELDSLITNRSDDKDITEYSRVVGTFIKFMDLLKPNIIFIAATNMIDKIDSAVIRRFNVKIQGKSINFNHFYEFIDSDLDLRLSTNEKNLLQEIFKEKKFTLSDAKQFVSNYIIESKVGNIKNNWAYILVTLNGLEEINFTELSKTKQEEIKKAIKQHG